MTTETQDIILQQIGAKELKLAGFFVLSKFKEGITLYINNKNMTIEYNKGMDDYTLRMWNFKGKNFMKVKEQTLKGIHADQLQAQIEEFFNFIFTRRVQWEMN